VISNVLDGEDLAALVARHPDVFEASRRKTLIASAAALAVILYLFFVWWFFSLGTVFVNGRWDIAGSYLADWVSYESRPDIAFEDGYLEVVFPRFDPMGNDPDPDWLVSETATVQRAVSDAGPSVSGGGASSSATSFLGTIGTPHGGNGGSAAPARRAVKPPARSAARRSYAPSS